MSLNSSLWGTGLLMPFLMRHLSFMHIWSPFMVTWLLLNVSWTLGGLMGSAPALSASLATFRHQWELCTNGPPFHFNYLLFPLWLDALMHRKPFEELGCTLVGPVQRFGWREGELSYTQQHLGKNWARNCNGWWYNTFLFWMLYSECVDQKVPLYCWRLGFLDDPPCTPCSQGLVHPPKIL